MVPMDDVGATREGSAPDAARTGGRLRAAAASMDAFAARTGIGTAAASARRYLWTDAFAVCTFVGLHAATGASRWLALARQLVDAVHTALGRHRADDPRSGWLSGLPDDEGRRHPTRGGLRIGKPLPERTAAEPFDERLEWERDGQYFHYLTRWMHALARVAAATGERQYLRWAVELALAARDGFVHATADGARRLVWKASVDLARPLVAATGQHDALDGWLTCLALRAAAADATHARGAVAATQLQRLDGVIAELRALAIGGEWATADALGIGGLLTGAHGLVQLQAKGRAAESALLRRIVRAAASGASSWRWRRPLAAPPRLRLGFRELGLAIGLRAALRMQALVRACGAGAEDRAALERDLAALAADASIGDQIEACWLDPANRATAAWQEHLDINEVMLATALAPDGYLAA